MNSIDDFQYRKKLVKYSMLKYYLFFIVRHTNIDVKQFGISYESCVTREFVQLSTREVTQHLSELSLEEMQYTCDVLDKRNGKFIDMKLIEVIDETYFNRCNVYRYKANFERNEFLNEIRIWVNLDGKFAGIISREWKDEYVQTK